MKADPRYHACIIAGGSGERLWPMSRSGAPKHLLRLFSDRTLLEETIRRLKGVVADANIWIITGEAQVSLIQAAIPWFPVDHIIGEPAKRDTAPAAALATGLVRARSPDGVLALLPADALIKDAERFGEQLSQALAWADASGKAGSSLLTFAIPASFPATGYGYLELGPEIAKGSEGSRLLGVKRFVEKPDEATARGYLADGHYAWNSGIFVWSVGRFLAEAERVAPDLGAFIRDFPAGDPSRFLAERFASLTTVSVDYAILEKAKSVATVLADFDWDDVGSWTSLPKHLPAGDTGSVFKGQVVAVDSSNTIAISNGRVIALCGVKDLVVVETADAVLVCHRDAVQGIKKLLPQLPKELK
jgi:mannose-1-phosphate guanylyltransferase